MPSFNVISTFIVYLVFTVQCGNFFTNFTEEKEKVTESRVEWPLLNLVFLIFLIVLFIVFIFTTMAAVYLLFCYGTSDEEYGDYFDSTIRSTSFRPIHEKECHSCRNVRKI